SPCEYATAFAPLAPSASEPLARGYRKIAIRGQTPTVLRYPLQSRFGQPTKLDSAFVRSRRHGEANVNRRRVASCAWHEALDRGQHTVLRPQRAVLREILKKARNPTIGAPLGDALQRAQPVREQRDEVDRHRVLQTVSRCKVPAARLEPVGRQPLRRPIALGDPRTLTRDVHDAALGHVPGREARLPRAKAEIGLFVVKEVVLVEAADRVEYCAANHHRGPRYPIDRLRDRAHVL